MLYIVPYAHANGKHCASRGKVKLIHYQTVRSERRVDGPAVRLALNGGRAIDGALADIAADSPEAAASVLLLGRYRHLKPDMGALQRTHRPLALSFSTAHGAKGLEADYVVVLGLCSGTYGFPSEVSDDEVLNLALAAPEAHPNAEERRLLYVALTRAKRRAYILADPNRPSAFVKELTDGRHAVALLGGAAAALLPDCPSCGGNFVKRRSRSGRAFFGCANHPYCERTAGACPKCGEGLPVMGEGGCHCGACGEPGRACPLCGSWLVLRNGPYGPFHGCTGYPICRHTEDSLRSSRPSGYAGVP